MLVKEIVYAILDLVKGSTSDDILINEEHVLFLAKKYRSFLIKKEQEKEKNAVDVASEFEYQQICLTLDRTQALADEPCSGYYLKSNETIPKILKGTYPKLYPVDYYSGAYITYISRDRMRFVGTNKYLQNIIYASLGPDMHLYLTSSNPQFLYLEKLRMSAIFEDMEDAADLLCDDSGDSAACDVLDMEFPIRDYLVPTLIELVEKEILSGLYRINEPYNNAKDDIPSIVNGVKASQKQA